MKRFLSILLSATLIFGAFTTAYAADTDTQYTLEMVPTETDEYNDLELLNSFGIMYNPDSDDLDSELISTIYVFDKDYFFNNNTMTDITVNVTDDKVYLEVPNGTRDVKYPSSPDDKAMYHQIQDNITDFFVSGEMMTLNEVSTEESTGLYLNNEPLDVDYIYYEDAIVIPFRDTLEAMDYTIEWNNEEQKIYFYKDAMYGAFVPGSNDYYIQGEDIKAGATVNIDGTTYLPLKSVEPVLGLSYELTPSGAIYLSE